MATVVWFLASAAAILSALAVVVQRNPFISALALIGNLASLATLYLLLSADFVAAAQVIVYAGAVMVMFLFVIAYIGPRGEVRRTTGRRWQLWAAIVAAAAILAEIGLALGRAGLDTPSSVDPGFGSPDEIGRSFLTSYLLAFEVVSLLLLVAAVAGVVLGSGERPSRHTTPDDEEGIARAGTRRGASAALLEQYIAPDASYAGSEGRVPPPNVAGSRGGRSEA